MSKAKFNEAYRNVQHAMEAVRNFNCEHQDDPPLTQYQRALLLGSLSAIANYAQEMVKLYKDEYFDGTEQDDNSAQSAGETAQAPKRNFQD